MAILYPVLKDQGDTTEVRKALLSIQESLIPGLSSGALASSGGGGFRERLMILSNNTSDPNNDIDIAPGKLYANDDTSQIELTATLTKRLDASWAVGSGNGGLDTGSKANSTWYYLYVIKNGSGTVDAIFSTSNTAPALPSGYTLYRRIGSVRTDGSGNIRGFVQIEKSIRLKSPPLDLNVTNQGTTSIQRTLTIPVLPVVVSFTMGLINANNALAIIYVRATGQDDLAPSATAAPLSFERSQVNDGSDFSAAALPTSDGTLWTRAGGANSTVRISTLGWDDLTL